MVVENPIVGAEAGLFIGGAGTDYRAVTDTPPVVFIPVGAVAAADKTDAAFVRGLKPDLPEARGAIIGAKRI